MSDQTATGLTDTELDEFAGRIATWVDGLAPGEHALWDAMLVRAATPRDDVDGYIATFRLLPQLKELESRDRLDNFEIQDLMSSYNQAETLASKLLRGQNHVNTSIIGAI